MNAADLDIYPAVFQTRYFDGNKNATNSAKSSLHTKKTQSRCGSRDFHGSLTTS